MHTSHRHWPETTILNLNFEREITRAVPHFAPWTVKDMAGNVETMTGD